MIYYLFSYSYNGKSRSIRVDADSKMEAIDIALNKVCSDEHIHRCELTDWCCFMVRNYREDNK